MNPKKRITLLLTLIILPPFIIFLSRKLFPPNYIYSSLYKIIFLFPLIFRIFLEQKTFKQSLLQSFSFKSFRKNLIFVFIIGIALTSIYALGFFIFKNHLDLSAMADKLGRLVSLNPRNLIFIGLYMICINSLLEEFFWRGFIFKELNGLIKPYLAHLITGIAFSLHHVMFYYNWFNLPLFLLATAGLALYAIIMNFIFRRYQDLYSCWLIHALVDITQIFIAFKIFGLL